MHTLADQSRQVSAEEAAAACMPNPNDVLSAGYSESFLSNLVDVDRLGSAPCNRDWASTDYSVGEERLGTTTKSQGWEYNKKESIGRTANDPIGPANIDTNWVNLRSFSRFKASAEKKGVSDGAHHWDTAARFVSNAGKGGVHCTDTFHATDVCCGMTKSGVRDTLFLIAYKSSDNEIRIPVTSQAAHDNAQGRWMMCYAPNKDSDGNTTEQVQLASETRDGSKPGIFPQGVAFGDLRECQSIPRFGDEIRYICNVPAQVREQRNLDVNPFRNRLDCIVNAKDALPACTTATQYELGQPLKMENGVLLFNKKIGNAHAALVVEMSAFLTSKPGIFGGAFGAVPLSFRRSRGNAFALGVAGEHEVLATGSKSTFENQNQEQEQGEECEYEFPDADPSGGDERALDAMDDDTDRLRNGQSAMPPTAASDAVLNADAATRSIRAGPGALQHARRASIGPDAIVHELGYFYEMSSMYFTYMAIGTLHNDRASYVEETRANFPDVFANETFDETLHSIPHLIMRYCGIPSGEATSYALALSEPMPLTETRTQSADKHNEVRDQEQERTLAYISSREGRVVDSDDPLIRDYNARKFGRHSALRTPHSALRTPHSALRTFHAAAAHHGNV